MRGASEGHELARAPCAARVPVRTIAATIGMVLLTVIAVLIVMPIEWWISRGQG